QLVLDARRDHREHLAPDQAVALQPTQRLRQHLGGDAFDLPLQLAVAAAPCPQRTHHQIDPLARQHLQNGVRHALSLEGIVAERFVTILAIHEVRTYRKGAYWTTGYRCPIDAVSPVAKEADHAYRCSGDHGRTRRPEACRTSLAEAGGRRD